MNKLKSILNQLILTKNNKDYLEQLLKNNGSSEKIVCNLDENIGGDINNDKLNKIFSSLDFINGNPEDIMDKFIIKWKIANNEILVSKCIAYYESFGSTYDDIDVVYKAYIFTTEEGFAAISILYKQLDMSFYGVQISNPYYNPPV